MNEQVWVPPRTRVWGANNPNVFTGDSFPDVPTVSSDLKTNTIFMARYDKYTQDYNLKNIVDNYCNPVNPDKTPVTYSNVATSLRWYA